ncbi:hypothetical protein JRQ81_015542 [Phrynocephalus forsythii]|uniref:Uncharacterized protein n=1 Tax=Phrynocephalus forsythii TaxID=171643 RepID=A0A9Q0XU57_9SAUR|nr:hypothetical protein JRQ81_015542 [Phrynocephalus forsythii]
MPLLFLLCTAASCLLPAPGEVVPDFTNCLEFFLDRMPPDASLVPPGAVRICQFYKNAYRFATMYDKEKRIPVYSAYTCKQGKGPRLDDRTPGKSMEDEWDTNLAAADIEKNQATVEDYRHFSKLNQEVWANFKNQIKKEAHVCKDLYVITGAVPGEEYISDGRVASHIWSAACCVREKHRRTSWAAIAKNDENKVKEQSLEKLTKVLAELYGKGKVDLFNNACK